MAIYKIFLPWECSKQVGWGFKQPGLEKGVPTHGSGVEQDDL